MSRFVAWQEPTLFSSEVRAAFRSLRWPDAGGRHAGNADSPQEG